MRTLIAAIACTAATTGDAGSLSCEILDGRLMDSGIAGDGHDVNCLTRASALS
ncbi:hypothetical protein [Mycobacterium sp. URHD0025]|uniref:hypothetical protein n=1 Tax=Mycobacterium sp. URHD0025 TaxID=1298864 RepID=UPI0003FEF93D|nr:hypothetical protein [Mycobacterium sp. URHD0025]